MTGSTGTTGATGHGPTGATGPTGHTGSPGSNTITTTAVALSSPGISGFGTGTIVVNATADTTAYVNAGAVLTLNGAGVTTNYLEVTSISGPSSGQMTYGVKNLTESSAYWSSGVQVALATPAGPTGITGITGPVGPSTATYQATTHSGATISDLTFTVENGVNYVVVYTLQETYTGDVTAASMSLSITGGTLTPSSAAACAFTDSVVTGTSQAFVSTSGTTLTLSLSRTLTGGGTPGAGTFMAHIVKL